MSDYGTAGQEYWMLPANEAAKSQLVLASQILQNVAEGMPASSTVMLMESLDYGLDFYLKAFIQEARNFDRLLSMAGKVKLPQEQDYGKVIGGLDFPCVEGQELVCLACGEPEGQNHREDCPQINDPEEDV